MSLPVIGSIILELRARNVPVGLQETIALAGALSKGLHENSLEKFYYLARSLLIHDEANLDDFDQVFGHVFQGIPYAAKSLAESLNDEMREWLTHPLSRPELTEEERNELKELNLEELLKLFEERLQEQKERHDGGPYWIGTGGRSPFGTGGYHPSGISLRSGPSSSPGGGRSMIRSADARKYRSYRHDLVLDVRQMEVALRKLRILDREGAQPELDLHRTIDATARNFGELELVFKKNKRSNTRVILMMDVGGSMDPYAALVSQLFSASKRATHWRELRTYYFHNCVYSRVYSTDGLRDAVSVKDLLRECDSRYKLILVGDAAMAPYELTSSGWSFYDDAQEKSGLDWLMTLKNHFQDSIWLNPDLTPSWRGSTSDTIATLFPMFPLTINGLEDGLLKLRGKSR